MYIHHFIGHLKYEVINLRSDFMIYNEPIKMKWKIKHCAIQDDEIVEVKGFPDEVYNPFDFYDKDGSNVLYRKFISVDENSNDEIWLFIRTYGFLGLNDFHRRDPDKEADERVKSTEEYYEKYMTMREHVLIKWFAEKIDSIIKTPRLPFQKDHETFWSKVSKNPELIWQSEKNKESDDSTEDNSSIKQLDLVEALKKYVETPAREKISDIKTEITRMRLILTLWESLSFRDIDSIDKNTLELWIFGKDENTKQHLINDFAKSQTYEQALFFAKQIITGEINKQINHVRPYLSNDSVHDFLKNPSKALKGYWNCPDLLSAMYIMIYMDFVQGKMIRKCKNETCSEWFEIYGNDDRKIYCTSKCANTQGKREARRVKKESKV
jgi:hypothetical protein